MQTEQLNIRKENFLSFNIRKLFHVLNNMDKTSQKVFHTITYLLNINSDDFPGYVKSTNNCFAIHGYKLNSDTISDIHKALDKPIDLISATITTDSKDPIIQSLFLMGSLGSIGHTEKSDFDYWVVIDIEDDNNILIEELSKKLKLIEQWAVDFSNMEVHFFITNTKNMRDNDFGSCDKESAGSALGKLLKDEFYRSSILIKGKIPYFWITDDNCNDNEYDKLVTNIKNNFHELEKELIDIGNIYNIDKKEFYGALLWQMYKGLTSPFKSVIKMGLLHCYFKKTETSQILSNYIKARIHSSSFVDTDFDSYMMIFDKVFSFYEEIDDDDVLSILKRAFLLKVNFSISENTFNKKKEKISEDAEYKSKVIIQYINKWGWEYDKFLNFSNEDNLSFEDNIELGKNISSYMLNVYKEISDEIKEKGENKITDTDLTVLGKKISSYISVKKNKVKLLPLCSRKNCILEDITIIRTKSKTKKPWKLFIGRHSDSSIFLGEKDNLMLLECQTLSMVFAYLVNNRITDEKTQILIHDKNNEISNLEFMRILQRLLLFFKPFYNFNLSKEKILEKEYIKRLYYILNFETKSVNEEDIRKVDIIVQNSLGEMFLIKFRNNKEIKESIHLLTSSLPKKINNFSDYFRVHAAGDGYSYFQKLYFTKILNQKLLECIGERRKRSRSKLDFVNNEDIFHHFEKKRIENLNIKLDFFNDRSKK